MATTVAPLHSTMGALLIGVLISGGHFTITIPSGSSYCNAQSFNLHVFGVKFWQPKLSRDSYMVNGAVLGLIQRSFTLRSFSCRSMIVMVLLSVTIVLASFAITIAYFEKCWSDDTWSELANLSKLSRAINGLNFGGDITVTFATVCLLRHSKSGVRRTDALMNRLIKFCMKTGLLTTYIRICAVLSLISVNGSAGVVGVQRSLSTSDLNLADYFCVYHVLLHPRSSLNARESLRKGKRTSKSSDITLSAIRWARDMDSPAARDYSKAALPISIQQEVHVSRDIEMGGSESSNPSFFIQAEASSYTG
ncbi:hypothetical protein EV360DRAFT_75649 [Lentinula raphanica]|nr:hypothetical protein EV360DRAFT_75649 [Lentinula raphanica]